MFNLDEEDKYAKLFVKEGGDEALFWAGRMAILIDALGDANILRASYIMEQLVDVKNRYDKVIFSRIKTLKL